MQAQSKSYSHKIKDTHRGLIQKQSRHEQATENNEKSAVSKLVKLVKANPKPAITQTTAGLSHPLSLGVTQSLSQLATEHVRGAGGRGR